MSTLAFVRKDRKASSGQSYTGGIFTPIAGDGLIVAVTVIGNTVLPTITDGQGLGWTRLGSPALFNSSGSAIHLFASNNPAAASAMALTADLGAGQSALDFWLALWRVSGAAHLGSAAMVSGQFGKQENVNGVNVPAPTLPVAAQGNNACICALGLSTSFGDTSTPSGWTQDYNDLFNGSTSNAWGYHASGFTGTTVPFTDHPSTGASFAAVVVEFDLTAATAFTGSDSGSGSENGISTPQAFKTGSELGTGFDNGYLPGDDEYVKRLLAARIDRPVITAAKIEKPILTGGR
jgi:hypothetical protein